MARNPKYTQKKSTWVTPKISQLIARAAKKQHLTESEFLRIAIEGYFNPPVLKIRLGDDVEEKMFKAIERFIEEHKETSITPSEHQLTFPNFELTV